VRVLAECSWLLVCLRCSAAVHASCVPSYPTFKIQDADEKIKARQEIVKGALADKLTLLSKHIEGRCVQG
jgi:hypothetical protein